MNAAARVWVIYVVAFDDSTDPTGEKIEPFVGKESIENVDDAEIAAFMRGGNLAATIRGNEADAERARLAVEQEVLRR
jgi:cell division GTPase FtsZ